MFHGFLHHFFPTFSPGYPGISQSHHDLREGRLVFRYDGLISEQVSAYDKVTSEQREY